MIELYTLGTFSLVIDGKIITDNRGRTRKLWKLLNLLAANRSTPLSIPGIIESIWPDEETEDCNKSLHNLIFRLRKMISSTSEGKSTIQFLHNSYALLVEDDFYVDAYEFEDICLKAKRADVRPEEKINLLERAFTLYKGKYLMDSYEEVWALTQTGRYRRMYAEAVVTLSDLYLSCRNYEEVMRICEAAIVLEPLEEEIYERLIRSLLLNGQKIQAISVCEDLFDLLYRELGVSAADNIHALYRQMKEDVIQTQHNVGSVLRTLSEQETENRAFACNMETFQSIYRYEVRQSVRRKESISLALLSITDQNHNLPSPHILAGARLCLFESCLSTLRRGDIVSAYSSSQIIVLLAGFSSENGHVILKRIREKFAQLHPGRDILIQFETKPLQVGMLMEKYPGSDFPELNVSEQPPISHPPLTIQRSTGSIH